ncbi:hypothetical protein KM043_013881 [Ampulex compressa]|nr:hypothetical protein KM043_013881 [Ampulex compressa]
MVAARSYADTVEVPNLSQIPPVECIRNFSIIAHVDHGKSTLADRLLENTGAICHDSRHQVLDKLQVERDRGITVKAQTASLFYHYKDTKYMLNLIDTPGHVDFSTEVRYSLMPCQGVLLVVDANAGVQAQTISNFHLATEQNLTIIPVINKIDLKNANPERVIDQLNHLFGINNAISISAKLGIGIEEVLNAVVERIPPPDAKRESDFRALTFDTWYDRHKGVISLIYVKEGSLNIGQKITSMRSKKVYEVKGLSILRPEEESLEAVYAGQIACMACNMKSLAESFIGDTLHLKDAEAKLLCEFKPTKPMVYAGIFPVAGDQYLALKAAVDKLALNDRGVLATEDSSAVLGRGWRIGFLGLLHMEVFIQRLEQEYGAEPVVTAPSVTYRAKIFGKKNVKKYGNDIVSFNNPTHFPPMQMIEELYEPMILATIVTPSEYLSAVRKICMERRGEERDMQEIGKDRLMLKVSVPLNEVILDFHDTLKCLTSGYASFDYEDDGYQTSKIIKMDVALNSNVVEELSSIIHASRAEESSRTLCAKLAEIIPRQQFEIVIQALIGTKVLARKTIKPYRKDVTAKLYGGDVTRRMKLLKKQAEDFYTDYRALSVVSPFFEFVVLIEHKYNDN